MNQTPVLKPCVLDKLVKYFSEKYRGSEDYYGRRERVRRFREKLDCNKIKQRQVTEKDLGEFFLELWVTGRGANLKRALEKHGLDGVLSKLEYLACRDEWRGVGKDVLKNIVLGGFGVATITELATCLYPEEFFIYNKKIRDPINDVLIKRGIVEKIDLPPVNSIEGFWRLYDNVE